MKHRRQTRPDLDPWLCSSTRTATLRPAISPMQHSPPVPGHAGTAARSTPLCETPSHGGVASRHSTQRPRRRSASTRTSASPLCMQALSRTTAGSSAHHASLISFRAFASGPTLLESEKRDRNVVRHTCACFERRQLVPLVRHVAGIILRPFREQKCRRAVPYDPYVTKIAPARALERSTKKTPRSLCARVNGRKRRV